MNRALSLLLALASSCLIASTAVAGQVCAYAVTSALGFHCPLHAGATVCTDVSPVTGSCDARLDCIARALPFFCRVTLVPKSGPRAQCPAGSQRLNGVRCFAPQPPPTPTATSVPTPTATPGTVPPALLDQQVFRAADGTTYQLVSLEAQSAAQVRITTLSGSVGGVGSCNASPAAIPGLPVSAVTGVLTPAVALHPYAEIERTAVFMPNDSAVTFTPDLGGRLTLGSGAGVANVCANLLDCSGQPSVLPLVGLDAATGGVPAACIANDLTAACDGSNVRSAFAFGLPSQGAPPVCTNPSSTTIDTTLCAPTPSDGFTLHSGESIVFVHGNLQGVAYSVGVAGFAISAQPGNVCAAGEVVGSFARIEAIP